MNWTKLGLNVLKALPAIQQTVESIKGIGHGGDKKDAVIASILQGVDLAQTIADWNVLNDPRVIAVIGKANDIAVEVQNVIAQVTEEHRNTN